MVYTARPPSPVTTRGTATLSSLTVEHGLTVSVQCRLKPAQLKLPQTWSLLVMMLLCLVRRALWTALWTYPPFPAKVHLLVKAWRKLQPRPMPCFSCAPLTLRILRKRKAGLLPPRDLNPRVHHRRSEAPLQLNHRLKLKRSSLHLMMMIISPTLHCLNFQVLMRSTQP